MIRLYRNHIFNSVFAFHKPARHAEGGSELPVLDQQVGWFDLRLIPYVIEQVSKAPNLQFACLQRLPGGG